MWLKTAPMENGLGIGTAMPLPRSSGLRGVHVPREGLCHDVSVIRLVEDLSDGFGVAFIGNGTLHDASLSKYLRHGPASGGPVSSRRMKKVTIIANATKRNQGMKSAQPAANTTWESTPCSMR